MATKVRDWRPTPLDPPLGVVFPDFADWTIVRVTEPGARYPATRTNTVLTVRHWLAPFHVIVKPPTLTRGETHEQDQTSAHA